MLKKTLIFFLIIFSIFSTFNTYASNSEIFIPLDSKSWQGKGQLTFNGNSYLEWHPKERGSLILSRNLPSNWECFNCIKFDCNSLANTGSWIYIMIGTDGNSFLYSYITINWTGWKSFTLTFNELFSSFAKVGNPDLRKVKYLALQTHPDAFLNVSKCSICISNLRLSSHKDENLNTYNVKLPPYNDKNLFFDEAKIQNIRTLLINKENKNLSKVFGELVKNANNIFNNSEKANLSVIRDAALLGRINNDSALKKLSLINFSNINETHWDKLLQENDILVQEDFINYVLTYDLLREEIETNSKIYLTVQRILNYVALKEIEICKYWISYYPYGYANNHVTRAALAAGIAMLAIDSPNNKRDEIFNLSLNILDRFFNFQISNEGVLNEGTHYFTYLTEILSYFAHFLKNLTSLNIFSDFPFSGRLKNLIEWSIKIRMPDGFLPCIDDSWQSRVVYPQKFISEFFPNNSSILNWTSLNVFSNSSINNEPWNIEKSLYIPLYLYTYKEKDEVSEPYFEPSQFFASDSEVVFRENWKKDSAYLFLVGKSLSSLHEHDDTGNIQIYAYNSPILLTGGYGPNGWSSTNRDYYVSAKAHNVVEIDGKGPKGFYNGGVGPIDFSTVSDFRTFSKIDFANVAISHNVNFNNVSHNRFVYFIKKSNYAPFYAIILDKLNSGSERTFSANFHPAGELLSKKEREIEYGLKNLDGEDIKIKIGNMFDCKTTIENGFYSPYWGEEIKTKYIKYSLQGKSATFGTVILPYNADKSIELKTYSNNSNGVIEFSIAVSGKECNFTDYFTIDDGGNIKQLKYTGSNATISYMRKDNLDNKVLSYFVENCSYLNLNQKEIFFSPKKFKYLYFSKDSSLYKYYCEFELNYPSVKTFFNVSDFNNVLLDGKEITFEKAEKGIFLNLPAGKHILTFN